jgi:hypothetical protein
MDDILAKHLAKTLLFKENKKVEIKESTKIENNQDYYKYKVIDGKYYVNTENDLVVSEKIGIWKNRDVVKVNQENYVVMESNSTMIPLRHVSKEEFENNFTRSTNIGNKKKNVSSNSQSLSISKKEEISVNKQNPIPAVVKKEEPKSQESTEKYVPDIKKTIDSKKFEEDAEENASFFNMLEKKKDDPRVMKFFNYHADHMKKEFTQILEKFKTSQLARAMESGGGTNAVQYANGGTMNGSLNVTNQLIAETVIDTTGRQLVHKKTFDVIGDGSANTYTFSHNFGTRDILINVYDKNTHQLVFVSSINIDSNNTRIQFPNNVEVGQDYRVILFA